ncbi:MAG: DUF3553 domain-containing protein [Planctomycetota bacterium]
MATTPQSPARYAVGETVKHLTQPQWGIGTVRSARPIQHQGVPAQNLRIQFPNRGIVTLNSAVAPLAPVESDRPAPALAADPKPISPRARTISRDNPLTPPTPATPATRPQAARKDANDAPTPKADPGSKGWLDQLEGPSATDRNLWDLPPELTDPFATPEQRLEATLKTYRFNTQPGPLFEWAVTQTGLDDPLSAHTRVELEQAFPRFARDRDAHLRELVKQLKRSNEHEFLRKLMNKTQHPPARSALEKAIRN